MPSIFDIVRKATLNVEDRISTDFDSKIKEWVNKMSSVLNEKKSV